MILLIGFYAERQSARAAELVECLERNTDLPHLERIVVFLEDRMASAPVRERFSAVCRSKLQLIEHGRRVTYAALFEYANTHCGGHAVIVANADIYFDHTLQLLDDEPLDGKMLCLSRWDRQPDGTSQHFDRPDSQDAWIFEAPLPPIACDFHLGKPGCDNRLAYEAERAGLAVSNPSRSLRAHHLHLSAVRTYEQRDRVPGPLRFVPASYLTVAAEREAQRRPPVHEYPSHRGRRTDEMRRERCREVEAELERRLPGCVTRALRREVRHATALHVRGPNRPLEPELARVEFRESMGYTLAKLELGASTHNNDPRPLVSIPAELADLHFTQVVSNHAAPVEIAFASPGRLFVLAAPGWEGFEPAARYLDDAGWREPIEPLRAADGTTFEVWSLVAECGEHLVLPTQVMLVSQELVRLD